MARAQKKTGTPKTFPNGMSRKHMKRKKPIDSSYMVPIKPLTDNAYPLLNTLYLLSPANAVTNLSP